ncbi:MAG TPA: hypothetical protein VFX16_22410 [Pseudonocardiaceae bacterium]|nr:hypothetical protein [Pseudonocardiaceae bacterium]
MAEASTHGRTGSLVFISYAHDDKRYKDYVPGHNLAELPLFLQPDPATAPWDGADVSQQSHEKA